jgi:hypothetical protein
MENVETILEGLLELVRLDMQLRKTGKETAERRQVEDAINSVRAKLPEPILGHFDRQKSNVPEFEKCWQAYERPVGDSWRVDETYLKVGGQWTYLYRAVDKQGKTVESYLSRTRDVHRRQGLLP